MIVNPLRGSRLHFLVDSTGSEPLRLDQLDSILHQRNT